MFQLKTSQRRKNIKIKTSKVIPKFYTNHCILNHSLCVAFLGHDWHHLLYDVTIYAEPIFFFSFHFDEIGWICTLKKKWIKKNHSQNCQRFFTVPLEIKWWQLFVMVLYRFVLELRVNAFFSLLHEKCSSTATEV